MEILKAILVGALVLALIYLKLRGIVSSLRELRSKRYGRLEFYGPPVIMALTMGACVVNEQLTGTPFGTEPKSYVIRWTFIAFAFALGVALELFVKRLENGSAGGSDPWLASASERRTFVAGKVCPACNQTMKANRLVQAVNAEEEGRIGWIHRCECGELTLFQADGRVTHVEDRTGGRRLT